MLACQHCGASLEDIMMSFRQQNTKYVTIKQSLPPIIAVPSALGGRVAPLSDISKNGNVNN